MKTRKMWAYFIAISMLLCQNVVFMTSASADAAAAPLIYYNFGDTAEWDSTDILAYTSDSNTENSLTVSPEKRVREYTSNYHVSFVNDGDYGQVLQMPAGNKSTKYMAFHIDDGTGSVFSTKRNLYIKIALRMSSRDAEDTGTNVQVAWSYPWSNLINLKKDTTIMTNNGWYILSAALPSSSHGNMTSRGPTLRIDNKFTDAYEIKYIALFDSQETANSWDPSVTAVTSNGVSASIDNVAHIAQFAESVKGNPTLTLAEGASAVKTLDVDGRSYGLGRRVKYNVTDIAGNVTEWQINYGEVADDTSILEEREYGSKKFYIYDFSTEQNMATVTASQVAFTGNDSYSKVQYDSLDTKPIASLSDSYGPAMEVSSDGATQYPYVLLNDQIDTSYRFVKLAYGVYKLKLSSAPSSAKEYYGTLGFGDMYQTEYLTATNTAGAVDAIVTNSSGETVETGSWTSSVVTIPQSADATSVLDITTVNAGDANVSADSRIAYKYIALFDNLEDATAYDPSIVSAKFDDADMTVDNFNHTMTLALQTGVTEGKIKSIEDRISVQILDDDVVEIHTNDDPIVNETSESVTVTQEFEVVGIDGESVIWTATVTAPIVEPAEDYLFFDFTTMPNNEDMRLQDGSYSSAYDTRPYGYEIGKTSSDTAREIYCANFAYGGPALFVRGAGSGTYTQFLLYSEKFDMAKTKYVRIEYSPGSTSTELGNDGAGRVVARWEDTNGNGNVVSYPAGSPPEAKQIHTAIIKVDPVNSNNKTMRIGFYNFAPSVNIKNIGIFETMAEAEAFDSSVRSVRIADNRKEVIGKTAKINGITHTATVEIEDNIAPSDMPVLTAADISNLVLDNVGATTQHDYVNYVATAEIVADSQVITEDLTSVMSSVEYAVTDKTGVLKSWKFILKSKKNGMSSNQAQEQYYIYDFTNVETVRSAILDGSIKKRNTDLTDMYPANISLSSSELHTVNNGGKVGLEIDFPNDEVKFPWYLKTLLNYESGVAADSNIQIHWTTNWGTTGGRTTFDEGLSAGEWTTVTQDLRLAATTQPLGLYSNTGSDMNFKYIALFGSAADRDAFDPSVIGGKVIANGRTYLASVDNIAHTITFPTGCCVAEDLDSAVISLYNGGNGISAVANSSAIVESDITNDEYAIVKTYSVTGLDGSTTVWTAKVPFEAATIEVGESGVTVSYAEQMSLQKLIAIYNDANEVVDVVTPNTNEAEISFESYAAGEYIVKVFGFRNLTTFEPIIRNRAEIYYKD